ncbi:hypothetical protein TcasGA2_TC007895 [Tribolium castaneum]|uniref:Uncharacterized protein n=1 Tax=Tribolium castaneum TaxID=7070 RepID=D2A2X2_TRICA|nr:hypothetical protein TcasGA2_TC007895 [Tribolium castaneum]
MFQVVDPRLGPPPNAAEFEVFLAFIGGSNCAINRNTEFNSSAGGYVQSANLSQRRVITETLNGSWPICAIRAPIYHAATWNGRWAIHKSNTPRTLSSLSRDNSKNSGNIYRRKGEKSASACTTCPIRRDFPKIQTRTKTGENQSASHVKLSRVHNVYKNYVRKSAVK